MTKSIKVFIRPDKSAVQTRVVFGGGSFTPEEFTSMFMSILETYTEQLLVNNEKEAVFSHFNRVFGIFLNKIVPDMSKVSEAHKGVKDVVESTLVEDDKLSTEEKLKIAQENDLNRLAAYILARDLLVEEAKLTEESADLLLSKKLGSLKTPILGGEKDGGEEE